MPKVAVVDGRRTPFCKFNGVLAGSQPHELARAAITGTLEAMDLDPKSIESVVAGCVGSSVEAPNVGRQAPLEAGIPVSTPGYTVNQACASGLRAVTDASNMLMTGEVEVALAVGTESMSSYPLMYEEGYKKVMMGVAGAKDPLSKVKALTGLRPKHFSPVIALQKGLVDSFCGLNMGQTAEAMAKIFDLSRVDQDRVAMESHRRVAQGWVDGFFAEEVTAVCPPPKYNKIISQDVGYRPRQSLEALAKLRPAFDKKGGTVTAGNACMVTDGAAAVVLMNEAKAKSEGREPLATIKGWTYVGLQPGVEGLMGPAYAIPKALDKFGLNLSDIDLFEINEAFASVVLSTKVALASKSWCEEKLRKSSPVGDLDLSKVNIHGGALAVGHPLGATGARMILTLARAMKVKDVKLGMATLCVHGGLGAAVILER